MSNRQLIKSAHIWALALSRRRALGHASLEPAIIRSPQTSHAKPQRTQRDANGFNSLCALCVSLRLCVKDLPIICEPAVFSVDVEQALYGARVASRQQGY